MPMLLGACWAVGMGRESCFQGCVRETWAAGRKQRSQMFASLHFVPFGAGAFSCIAVGAF